MPKKPTNHPVNLGLNKIANLIIKNPLKAESKRGKLGLQKY